MIGRTGQKRVKEKKDPKKPKMVYELGSKPKLFPPALGAGLYFDNSMALLSRLYDSDRERVLTRAISGGVGGILCWNPEIEKLEELNQACSGDDSVCYFMAGIHPDNISRFNKAQQQAWHLTIDEYSRERRCIAVFSGLNLTGRDMQSHFAQESMLRCLYHQAKTLGVPLVVFVGSKDVDSAMSLPSDGTGNPNLSRIAEVLAEEEWQWDGQESKCIPVIVHDAIGVCKGEADIMHQIVSSGFHVSLSLNEVLYDSGIARSGDGEEARFECLAEIPLERILVASNSPHQTPQNIPDEYMRMSKNEPSNFSFLISFLSLHLGVSEDELSTLNMENSKRLYKIGLKSSDAVDSGSSVDACVDRDDSVGTVTKHMGEVALTGESSSSQKESLPIGPQYCCSKCSTTLFWASQLVCRHALSNDVDCPPTVFAIPEGAEVAYCDAVYFLPSAFVRSSATLGIDAKSNVSCVSCGAKLGKEHVGDSGGASCPCGHAVDSSNGGVLRLSNSKVKQRFGGEANSGEAVGSSKVASDRAKKGEDFDDGQVSGKAGVVNKAKKSKGKEASHVEPDNDDEDVRGGSKKSNKKGKGK